MRKDCADEVALLTPVIKAFFTDNGWIATSHCMQVFGGHGYIAEWGMEQYVRDARINMIYEGTNTIQSLDLLGRKVLADNGKKLKNFGKRIAAFVDEEGVIEAMQEFVNPLADLGDKVDEADDRARHEGVPEPGRGRRRGGRLPARRRPPVFAYFFARMAKVALDASRASGDPFYAAKLATARFYFAKLLPETAIADPQRALRRGAADGDGLEAACSRTRSTRMTTVNRFNRRKVAVLGAGVMGAQIAAHLVNAERAGGAVRPAGQGRAEERHRGQGDREPEEAQARRRSACRGRGAHPARPTTKTTCDCCATATW